MTLWLQVMQPLANVHETKWTPHVKRESDVAVHIIAVAEIEVFLCSNLNGGKAGLRLSTYTT